MNKKDFLDFIEWMKKYNKKIENVKKEIVRIEKDYANIKNYKPYLSGELKEYVKKFNFEFKDDELIIEVIAVFTNWGYTEPTLKEIRIPQKFWFLSKEKIQELKKKNLKYGELVKKHTRVVLQMQKLKHKPKKTVFDKLKIKKFEKEEKYLRKKIKVFEKKNSDLF